MTCQLPEFLEGPDDCEKPSKEAYSSGEDGGFDEELYHEDLWEYERVSLRKTFLESMAKREPEWIRVMETSVLKADFEYAVSMCDDDMTMVTITKWLDGIDAGGEYQSLLN